MKSVGMQRMPTFSGLKCATQIRQCPSRNVAFTRRQQIVVRSSMIAEPVDITVKKLDGSSSGTASISLRVAEPDVSKGLVHRYLVMVRQNARRGTASTLTRSEVRGGGRKPYKQKGSGNARLGSKRTPLRPGGGVVFGPKPRDWSISMNKKEKRLALATALQSAAADMIVVDGFAEEFTEIKTKSLVEKLAALGIDIYNEKALLVLNELNENVYLSGRNIERLAINTANAIQVYDLLAADKIVIEKAALDYVNEYYGGEKEQ